MSTKMINPKNAHYIKLGRNGVWEKDCLEVSQTLKLGYREISHDLCLQGRWDEVQQELLEKRDTVGAATKDKNQIRAFYESDEQVLWVTFFGDRLYWCFSNSEITLLSDKNKSRSVIGQWSSSDLAGKPLQKSQLSGVLLRMQNFRRSICQVKELKYLVEKMSPLQKG